MASRDINFSNNSSDEELYSIAEMIGNYFQIYIKYLKISLVIAIVFLLLLRQLCTLKFVIRS